MSILRRGLTGAPVARVQEKLGITADGIFGPGTEKAVKDFQKSAGLAVDGTDFDARTFNVRTRHFGSLRLISSKYTCDSFFKLPEAELTCTLN